LLRERIDPSLEVSPLGNGADSFEYSKRNLSTVIAASKQKGQRCS
jgi:hypothetical protein